MRPAAGRGRRTAALLAGLLAIAGVVVGARLYGPSAPARAGARATTPPVPVASVPVASVPVASVPVAPVPTPVLVPAPAAGANAGAAPRTEAPPRATPVESRPSIPAKGPRTYAFAPGEGPVFGTAGTVRRYRVAVEQGVPVPVGEFAAKVDTTLSDPRSWIAGHDVRLQRATDDVSFTVYLVTPGTAQALCAAGGLDIVWRGEPYTSCRTGASVVINLSRYLLGIPNYGAPLEAYQQYAINHEVGHALGHDHELCPGPGRPAPVMQQQTFSLQGCTANAWPYLDGRRYAGPPGRIVPPS